MDKDLRPFSKEEILENLKKLDGWVYKNRKITKEFNLASFKNVVKLIDLLAPFCEEIDHHPDIHIYYKKVIFELQRFSIGGRVCQRDFTVAQKIEKLVNNL